MKKLFKPLDYLKINHPQKFRYDFTIPVFLSSFLTIAFILMPKPIAIFGEDGLIAVVTGILQILSGFYIASLAAVATFDKYGLDQPISGKPIKLRIKIQNTKKEEILTRRRFLCLLFGYLAMLSIFLYFLGTLANLMTVNFKVLLPIFIRPYLKWFFVFLYLFLTSNLITTTLHGLYYMVDRIHRADPEIIYEDDREHLDK